MKTNIRNYSLKQINLFDVMTVLLENMLRIQANRFSVSDLILRQLNCLSKEKFRLKLHRLVFSKFGSEKSFSFLE